MTPPTHIYASAVSRRDRTWGRAHRRARPAARLLLFSLTLLVGVMAVTITRLPL